MITTMWIDAPAGVSGPGSLDVRPAAHAVPSAAQRLRALPLTAVVAGAPTCVPAVATPVFGIDVPGAPQFDLVPTGRGRGALRATDEFGTGIDVTQDEQNDGTTLGIPSSRRPLS
ncbi:hypothetical protein ACI79C_19575 [Geodermatophilus sp. SYSU D00697]